MIMDHINGTESQPAARRSAGSDLLMDREGSAPELAVWLLSGACILLQLPSERRIGNNLPRLQEALPGRC